MSRIRLTALLILLSVISLPIFAEPDLPEYRIGFLEAGEYPQFEALRGAYRTEIMALAKGKFNVLFPAEGYRSAAWNRDSCKIFARQLANSDRIDLIVATGPWGVFDLLEAGCTKPILAAHQFDPVGGGLLNEDGKPLANNVALTFDPSRLKRELSYIRELFPEEKLGVLYFPSGSGNDSTVARIRRMFNEMGGEIVSAEGYDNVGTYAFFKAYQELKGKVGAIYLGPTFGLTTIKTSPFFEMATRDRIPTISSAGRFHVTRGAMIGLGSDNLLAEAYYNARQTIQIMEGGTPAELPVAYQQVPVMSVNEKTVTELGVKLPRALMQLADTFGAPTADQATYLDLATALAHGLAASPDIGVVQARLKLIQAEAASESAALLPSLDLNARLGWQGDNAVDNSYGEAKKSYRSVSLNLSQPLIDFGRWAKVRSSEASVESAQVEKELVERLVEEGIYLAYYEVGRLDELQRLVTDQRRRIDLYAELSQAQSQAGEEDVSESARWQIERLQITKQLIELETEQRTARKVLSLLAGHGWSDKIVIDSTEIEKAELVNEYALAIPYIETETDVELTINKLTRLGIDNALSLKQARAEREYYGANRRVARSELWPSVSFDASLTYRDSLADLGNGFEEATPFWGAGLKLNWGLSDLLFGSSKRDRVGAAFERAGFELDSRRLEVAREVTSLAENWILSLDKLPVTEEWASQASYYLDGMTEKYITNQIGQAEIKDALDSWTAGMAADINERFAYYRNAAGLMRALGGSSNLGSSTPGRALFEMLSR